MVQRGARTEPLELVRGHRVADGDLERLPVPTRHAEVHNGVRLALEEVREAKRLDGVPRADASVVDLVDEPERQDALFLRYVSAEWS